MKKQKLDIYKSVKKMILGQSDKYTYITHYRNLKFFVRMHMKITKVHKIVSFNQSPLLRVYIMLNTEKRASSKSKAKQNFHKLLNNAFFRENDGKHFE